MFQRGVLQAERIVERLDTNHSLKAAKPIEFKHDDEDKYTQHFGTIKYTEDFLEDYTFEVCHETGDSSYPIRDIEIDYALKVCEVV